MNKRRNKIIIEISVSVYKRNSLKWTKKKRKTKFSGKIVEDIIKRMYKINERMKVKEKQSLLYLVSVFSAFLLVPFNFHLLSMISETDWKL